VDSNINSCKSLLLWMRTIHLHTSLRSPGLRNTSNFIGFSYAGIKFAWLAYIAFLISSPQKYIMISRTPENSWLKYYIKPNKSASSQGPAKATDSFRANSKSILIHTWISKKNSNNFVGFAVAYFKPNFCKRVLHKW